MEASSSMQMMASSRCIERLITFASNAVAVATTTSTTALPAGDIEGHCGFIRYIHLIHGFTGAFAQQAIHSIAD